MTTTIDNITDDQILTLQSEAGAAGDDVTVDLCNLALGYGNLHPSAAQDAEGREAARRQIVEMIRAAEAMAD